MGKGTRSKGKSSKPSVFRADQEAEQSRQEIQEKRQQRGLSRVSRSMAVKSRKRANKREKQEIKETAAAKAKPQRDRPPTPPRPRKSRRETTEESKTSSEDVLEERGTQNQGVGDPSSSSRGPAVPAGTGAGDPSSLKKEEASDSEVSTPPESCVTCFIISLGVCVCVCLCLCLCVCVCVCVFFIFRTPSLTCTVRSGRLESPWRGAETETMRGEHVTGALLALPWSAGQHSTDASPVLVLGLQVEGGSGERLCDSSFPSQTDLSHTHTHPCSCKDMLGQCLLPRHR